MNWKNSTGSGTGRAANIGKNWKGGAAMRQATPLREDARDRDRFGGKGCIGSGAGQIGFFGKTVLRLAWGLAAWMIVFFSLVVPARAEEITESEIAETAPAIARMPTGIYRETEDYLEVQGVRNTFAPIAEGFYAEITNITDTGLEIVNYDGDGKDVGHIEYSKLDDVTYQCVSDILTWTLILHPESCCYETRYCFMGNTDLIAADIFTWEGAIPA